MQRLCFYLLLTVCIQTAANAQLNYISSNGQVINGSYDDLGTQGTVISTSFTGGVMTYDDDNSSIQNIGFNFSYNGKVYTQFILNTNGFIKLGIHRSASNVYDVLQDTSRDVIAAYNMDLDSSLNPEYRVFTSGTAGSRVCTIQFENLKEYSSSRQFSNMNFQIKLYETTNRIEFVFGSFTASTNAAATKQVIAGIKGSAITRTVNIKKLPAAAWASSTFLDGNYLTNKFDQRNSILPVPGLTFRFNAAPKNDVEVLPIYTLAKLPVPAGAGHIVRVRVVNAGAATVTNRAITLTVSGANEFTNTKLFTANVGDTALITFDAFTATSLGSNTVEVKIANDDITNNNLQYAFQIANSNTFSYADNSAATSSLGWGTGAGLFLTKYRVTGTALVNSVNVHLSNAPSAGNTVYAVVLNAAGTIVAQSANHVLLPGDDNKLKTFTITVPPSFTNADFYVGLAQTANATTAYYPLATQPETTPTRPGAYYYKSGLTSGALTESTNFGRFMIQAVMSGGASPSNNPFTHSYWTWMSGDSLAIGVNNVYGVKGVSSPLNKPASRAHSATWTDTSGNLWLFGGVGNIGDSEDLYWYNDLWKFDRKTNEWTWMKGDSTADSPGSYGSLGVPSDNNRPSARNGANYWTDKQGNFWLFGGELFGNQDFNDLWRYNVKTNVWTWIKGDSVSNILGVYGSRGVPASTNKPGGRHQAATWVDTTGSLWLFGGSGYSANGSGLLSDLWKYNITSNQWTFVKGDTITYVSGVYGLIDTPTVSTRPGCKVASVSWVDNFGNLWLFGGYGRGDTSSGSMNDMWRYNIASDQWTWKKGGKLFNAASTYGVRGIAASGNTPGGREGSVGWKDETGNLWMFGGGRQTFTLTNQLWRYNVATSQWIWVKGDTLNNEVGVYGSKNVKASRNTPGARYIGASWKDPIGNFWLFGGVGYQTNTAANFSGYLNDMWKIYGGATNIFTGTGSWDSAYNWSNNQVAPKIIPAGLSVIIDHFPPGICEEIGNLATQAGGNLNIQPLKQLNIINGNLINDGSVDGTGTVAFSGGLTALSSSGTISTPLILTNKQVFLTGNTNTSSIQLTGNSNIRLDNFHFNMGTGTLVADSTNFFITNGLGRLGRFVDNNPVDFHVGVTGSSYTPATITNTGTPGNLSVRVRTGTSNRTSATTDNVDRTWVVSDSGSVGVVLNLRLQWRQVDEQPGFDRSISYISQSQLCQPPPNCIDSYFDVIARSAALGNNPYTQTRSNIINPSNFIVKSGADVTIFTGSGDWNDPNNWTVGIVPAKVIGFGRELIIDHPPGGQCNVVGDIVIEPGGKLTVMPGKTLNITGKIILL